ncbi:MAG TPA: carbon monoxide dehydrogenase subunit G [Caulobacteraceae bacterium]|nr:carbon monoxide dehydrogenase subunit G [Caulobacteraceae bacterium]
MRQTGEYRLDAGRQAVWDALNDPDVLMRCIDGCESLERAGDDVFKARVRAKVGPLSAAFDGEVKLADLDPPRGYTLEVSAKGGAAGFGRGVAKVALEEDGGGTRLTYEAEGSVGGKLAQIGQRFIDAAARKTADDFFARLGEIVAPGGATKTDAGPAPASGGMGVWLIVGGIAVAIALAAVVVVLLRH